MTRALRWLVAWSALVLGGCTSLPDIPSNTCGNAVLEGTEDCDGFGREGLECRAPGESGQCHLDCSPGSNGETAQCPSGYGCDASFACRKATGAYLQMPERILGNAWSLQSGDFDGDGRADVLSAERGAVAGLTKVRAHYFDRAGVPTHAWASNDLLTTPTPIRIPGSPRQSVAVARFGGVGILTGESDGSLISEALPSYFLEGAKARVFAVSDAPIADSSALAIFTTYQGRSGLFRQGIQDAAFALVTDLPFGVEALAAEPIVTRLFDDEESYPCDDVVLAARGSREVGIYSLCERDSNGAPTWSEVPRTLSLAVSSELKAGLLTADLDGDGHRDLLVGTGSGIQVAYGDGTGFSAFTGAALDTSDGTTLGMPLAAGDLTGDLRADLVLPNGIYRAEPGSPARRPVYSPVVGRPGAAWTEAVIADMNRDGFTDAAAVSNAALDISFFNGTGSRLLNPFTITTDRPILHIVSGDYDGDLIGDLAIVQAPVPPSDLAEVSIAYGNPSGAPSRPRVSARVPDVQEIRSFRNSSTSLVSFLAMLYEQKGSSGVSGSAFAVLLGSTDRNPPCIVELTRFADDGLLSGATSLAVSVGSFTAPGMNDVAALAVDNGSPDAPDYELWLLPDITSRRASPTRLGWSFAQDMQPVLDFTTTPKLAGTMAAGDLDGDGLDELVMTAPDEGKTRCLVSIAHLRRSGAGFETTAPFALPGPCEDDTQISIVDLDGDGARDALVLFGDETRRLLALWGNGKGDLAVDSATDLSPAGAALRSFALLKDASGAAAIAAVSNDALYVLPSPSQSGATSAELTLITPLSGGSGITAADVDGDKVEDLVVAEAGSVRLLRAELAP